MNWSPSILMWIASYLIRPLFSISSEEEERIRNLYSGDGYRTMMQYYKNVESSQINPCKEYKTDQRSHYTSLSNVTIEELGLSVTLDDINVFKTPAVIECEIKKKDRGLAVFKFALMITETNGNLKFMQLYPDMTQAGRYTINDVKIVRILDIIFKDPNGRSGTEALYREIQYDDNHLSELCRKKYPLGCGTASNNAPFSVQHGKIVFGDFLLRLSERQNVSIPGILMCQIQYNNGKTHDIHYVLQDDETMYRIYNANAINDKRAFTIEPYLEAL